MDLSRNDLVELVGDLEEFLKSADTYLDIGDKAVASLRPVLSRALEILLEALNDIHKDLEPELMVGSDLKARGMRRNYNSYTHAGFTKDQAFMLVLASVKPFDLSEIIKNANLPNSRSKKES